MWISRLYAKYFLKNKQPNDNQIDLQKEKHIIRKLMTSSLEIKKNRLLLMCVLSAIVYQYNDPTLKAVDKTKTNGTVDKTAIEPVIELQSLKLQDLTDPKQTEDFKEVCYYCNLSDDNIDIYNIDNVLIFGIFYINKNLIISFKGSSNLNDFVSDMNFSTTKIHEIYKIKGKVHGGAYDILFQKERYRFILDKIEEFSGNTIYITGHSLGAMTASIFYAFLKEYYSKQPEKKIYLTTFGQPRTGDKTFSDSIEQIRVVDNNDIIPKVPLPFLFGYSHSNKLLHVGPVKTKNYFFNPQSAIEDHKIANYYNNIKELK
jgi:hypothetical protein